MTEPISVTVTEVVRLTGVGKSSIWEAIRMGDLVAHYPTSRPVIEVDELRAWIKSRDTEGPRSKR